VSTGVSLEATTETPSQAFCDAIGEFSSYLRVRNYSAGSIATYGHSLSLLARFLAARGIYDPAEVSPEVLETYRRHLAGARTRSGQPLAVATQSHRLQATRVFFRWMRKVGHLSSNPADALEAPKAEHRLPPATLSVEEIEAIMALPDVSTSFGLRDRAILEVFYSTAIRRCELMGLRLCDVDHARRTLFIFQGKGHKDRYVPIGTRALHWVSRYVSEVRPKHALPGDADEGYLFLAYTGKALSRDFLTEMVTEYVSASGTAKHGSCHLIRHTTATLMLEGGADIRYIAELLGHSRLETTQRYTQVSIEKLRQVHAATHPGAHLESCKRPSSKAV
jgi:integrase/recombinase XerD